MALNFVKFQNFTKACAHGVHHLDVDVLTLALLHSSNPPNAATNTKLSDLTQIAYTNLSSRVLTTSSSDQSGGTYRLVVNDITLTAVGGAVAPFQYIVIYNETAANDELIGYYNGGSNLTLNTGDQLVCDFDQVNGVIQNT